ncbi:T9SS type A sorting domain-containing protein [Candidatus Fermentibacterales bacterium]|nr:T9SS type A sorting domain-containing protein [Candidatus Fermentibacterales bacterium]
MAAHPSTSGTYWTCGFYSSKMAASRTTNGGASWTRYSIGSGTGMAYSVAIDPSAPSTVYVSGYENSLAAIYRTQNSGGSWTKLSTSGLNGWVYDLEVDPTDSSVLYAGGTGGGYRSANGGTSWSAIIPTSYDVYDLLIDPEDHETIYFATANNGVIVTEDAGGSWQQMSDGLPDAPILCLSCHAGSYLFSGTNGASGYRWQLQTGIEEQQSAPVSSLALRVFPNPAFGEVTVLWQLPEPGHVTLSVYDLQGRLVETLQDGYSPAAERQAAWAGERALPGVYLVRLETPGAVEASRLVILR